jgi:hypothetical protein
MHNTNNRIHAQHQQQDSCTTPTTGFMHNTNNRIHAQRQQQNSCTTPKSNGAKASTVLDKFKDGAATGSIYAWWVCDSFRLLRGQDLWIVPEVL